MANALVMAYHCPEARAGRQWAGTWSDDRLPTHGLFYIRATREEAMQAAQASWTSYFNENRVKGAAKAKATKATKAVEPAAPADPEDDGECV